MWIRYSDVELLERELKRKKNLTLQEDGWTDGVEERKKRHKGGDGWSGIYIDEWKYG